MKVGSLGFLGFLGSGLPDDRGMRSWNEIGEFYGLFKLHGFALWRCRKYCVLTGSPGEMKKPMGNRVLRTIPAISLHSR
jgi:hypothetical protein